MRALFITPQVKADIKRLKEKAAANPVIIRQLMDRKLDESGGTKSSVKLSDWGPGQRDSLAPYILIPRGFKVAYSIEEQPVGMCAHLSVSIDRKGKLPAIEAVEAIAAEFGMPMEVGRTSVWIEEFEPGYEAVNVVYILEQPRGGTA